MIKQLFWAHLKQSKGAMIKKDGSAVTAFPFESSSLLLHGVWLLSSWKGEQNFSLHMFAFFLCHFKYQFSQPVRNGDSACNHISGKAASGFQWQGRGVQFGFQTWANVWETSWEPGKVAAITLCEGECSGSCHRKQSCSLTTRQSERSPWVAWNRHLITTLGPSTSNTSTGQLLWRAGSAQ